MIKAKLKKGLRIIALSLCILLTGCGLIHEPVSEEYKTQILNTMELKYGKKFEWINGSLNTGSMMHLFSSRRYCIQAEIFPVDDPEVVIDIKTTIDNVTKIEDTYDDFLMTQITRKYLEPIIEMQWEKALLEVNYRILEVEDPKKLFSMDYQSLNQNMKKYKRIAFNILIPVEKWDDLKREDEIAKINRFFSYLSKDGLCDSYGYDITIAYMSYEGFEYHKSNEYKTHYTLSPNRQYYNIVEIERKAYGQKLEPNNFQYTILSDGEVIEDSHEKSGYVKFQYEKTDDIPHYVAYGRGEMKDVDPEDTIYQKVNTNLYSILDAKHVGRTEIIIIKPESYNCLPEQIHVFEDGTNEYGYSSPDASYETKPYLKEIPLEPCKDGLLLKLTSPKKHYGKIVIVKENN